MMCVTCGGCLPRQPQGTAGQGEDPLGIGEHMELVIRELRRGGVDMRGRGWK